MSEESLGADWLPCLNRVAVATQLATTTANVVKVNIGFNVNGFMFLECFLDKYIGRILFRLTYFQALSICFENVFTSFHTSENRHTTTCCRKGHNTD